MISEEQLNQLCLQGESFSVDYKRAQYAFIGGTDDQKADLLKDVLCFANSFRKTPAYILIGVDEEPSGIGTICGIREDEVIDDSKLQEFINSKTNRQIPFSAYPFKTAAGKMLQVIELDVCMAGRPYYLRKKFAWIQCNCVWMRIGSSSHIASPDEIAVMGRASFELETSPDIKTLLVSENGDSEELVSVSIDCDIKQPDNQFQRRLAVLSGGTEYDHYMWVKLNVAKLHFRLEAENVSRVNAEGLEFKYELKCDDGSVALGEAPSFDGSPFNLRNDLLSSARIRKTDLRPKEKDDCVKEIYLEVSHGGKFAIEVTAFGKNIPEPIKEIFTYSVSVEELRLSAKNVLWLNLATRKAEDVLLCIKWLVYQVKNHVPCADINAELLKLSGERLRDLAQ